MGKSITIGIVAAALSLGCVAAQAAGLGRLTVLSPLGQPLLAEIEIVSIQPGEEEGLSARLGSAEAFSQAGIEISPALLGLRVSLERRDRRPVLRLTTPQPVNEPFLDLLIELQWASGRLVREYTFLLDPPEYKSRQAIAAAPPPQAAAPLEKPAPAIEEKPIPPVPAPAPSTEAAPAPTIEAAPAPAAEAPKEEAAKPEEAKPEAAKPEAAKPAATTHEVKKGDTLGAIARANLQPGVTLNQMLIAIYRANEDAFIRGNINLVRTGKILNIPAADSLGTVDRDEANRLVQTHKEQWTEYRSRLAAVPTAADGTAGQREVAGRIEPKPAAPAPAAPADQLRLSKADPSKPAAPGARAAQGDDAVARERALKDSQSRSADLEKNVADLQKLLELKNQQLAELEKKAGAKPAPVPPVAQAPEKPAAKAPEKPAAEPAKPAPPPAPAAPAPQAAKPEPAKPEPAKPEAPKPEAAKPAPEKKAEAAKPKPMAAPPPETSMLDEVLDNPLYLGGLGAVLLLLVLYAAWSWRKKKAAHAKFQDSVLGAAAAGGGAAAFSQSTATASAGASQAPVSQAPAGMEAEEVDPIAEADVYMAYGRDAQAEEILKEALQKDSKRPAVHAKLLEIYANRKDVKSFEQAALKLKGLTHGSGPDWDKAAALGRSIDPQNGLYGGASSDAAAAVVAAPAAAAAPTLDFDLGGASQAATPDISLDEPGKDPTATGVDFDLGATQTVKMKKPGGASADKTVAAGGLGQEEKSIGSMDFNLDLGTEEKKPQAAPPPAAETSGGLDFDLSLGDNKSETPPQAPAMDLSSISLDLGATGDETVVAPQGSGDPKWQEVATKLDLAKAYEEMGDKDGARELLNEVMKDGDTAQKGQAQQLLAKLG